MESTTCAQITPPSRPMKRISSSYRSTFPATRSAVERKLSRPVLGMRVVAEVQRLELFLAVAEHLPIGAIPPERRDLPGAAETCGTSMLASSGPTRHPIGASSNIARNRFSLSRRASLRLLALAHVDLEALDVKRRTFLVPDDQRLVVEPDRAPSRAISRYSNDAARLARAEPRARSASTSAGRPDAEAFRTCRNPPAIPPASTRASASILRAYVDRRACSFGSWT
jgi:hypothetical protein